MSDDDIVSINGVNDDMAFGTITTAYPTVSSYTIDTSTWANTSITGFSNSNNDAVVSIDTTGINMKPDSDLRIGDRSLKDFMNKVEERLNILRPNAALEDKWDELAELGKRYRELEAEILEKERMWNILKDKG